MIPHPLLFRNEAQSDEVIYSWLTTRRTLDASDVPAPLKPAPQLFRSDFQVLAESRTGSGSPSTLSLARIRSIVGQGPHGSFQTAKLAGSLRHQPEYILARACIRIAIEIMRDSYMSHLRMQQPVEDASIHDSSAANASPDGEI